MASLARNRKKGRNTSLALTLMQQNQPHKGRGNNYHQAGYKEAEVPGYNILYIKSSIKEEKRMTEFLYYHEPGWAGDRGAGPKKKGKIERFPTDHKDTGGYHSELCGKGGIKSKQTGALAAQRGVWLQMPTHVVAGAKGEARLMGLGANSGRHDRKGGNQKWWTV